jgi:hypothetical protein
VIDQVLSCAWLGLLLGCGGGGEGLIALTPAAHDATDRLGEAVGISGDTILIGAPYRSEQVGAAYVFERDGDTWRETQMLLASTPRQQTIFGNAAAIDGDVAIVEGLQAFAFERVEGVWSQRAELVLPEGSGPIGGEEVALEGDRALLDGADEAAHFFVRDATGWRFEQTIRPSSSQVNDMFGSGLALSGETALLGASGGEAAYVFERRDGLWTETQKLTPPAPAESYGFAVAIEGELAVIGGTSTAFVYRRVQASWQLEQELDGAELGFCFGCAVELDAGRVIVSAWGGNVIVVYEHGAAGWTVSRELRGPSTTAQGDGFGFKLAAEGDALVASSVSGELGETYVLTLTP